ncbi:dihydroorotase [Croceiramulus getboli]|nr:dihydroorotase [Flavobacteriaceae bacterium YJPT1-3]
MKLFLKKVRILDPESSFHGQTVNLEIKNGIITGIGTDLEPSSGKIQTIEQENLTVSQGWFDSSVSLGEPGYEERETISNGLQVAAYNGFTDIAVNPNSNPITDTQADINFLKNKAEKHAVSLHPIGALTRNASGSELAELYDMAQAGAIAFGDYQKSISNPNLLKLALLYTQGFNGLVLSFPQDNQMAGKGQVHEHEESTRLGLKGIPVIAESLQIARDLHILRYTGGRLHIPTISTAKSVQLLRQGKADGLDVSCSVSIAHLLFTDAELRTFDTHFKLLPPLRTKEDQQALIEGLKDGTIDMVTSDHNPLDLELKQKEFDHAAFGTTAQEAVLGVLNRLVSEKRMIQLLTSARKRFTGITHPIAQGTQACLTLFEMRSKYNISQEDLFAKSKNSAFLGTEVKGRVIGIVVNNHYVSRS